MLKMIRFFRLVSLCAVGLSLLRGSASFAQTEAKTTSSSLASAAYKLRMDGKIDEAEVMLSKGLAANPSDAPAQFEFARISFLTSIKKAEAKWSHKGMPPAPDLGPASKAIAAAIERDPQNPRYHYWAGVISMYEGVARFHRVLSALSTPHVFRESIRHFERAVELNPDYYEARLALVALYSKNPKILGGDKGKTMRQIMELERRDPVCGVRGDCALRRPGQEMQQVALWEELTRSHPQLAEAHEGLGEAYVKIGNMEGAAREFETALRLRPQDPAPLLALGRGYCQYKRFAEAEAPLRRYLASSPPPYGPLRARGMKLLADSLAQQGKTEEAQTFSREASRLDPTGFSPPLPVEELYGAP